jgi:hypothetical protein
MSQNYNVLVMTEYGSNPFETRHQNVGCQHRSPAAVPPPQERLGTDCSNVHTAEFKPQ